MPVGASPWGPARRNRELGHGRAHGTGTVGYHHWDPFGACSAINLSIIISHDYVLFTGFQSSVYWVFSFILGSAACVRLGNTFPCLLPGSSRILHAAGLCHWGQDPTPQALQVLLFPCSVATSSLCGAGASHGPVPEHPRGSGTATQRARGTPQPTLSQGAAVLEGPGGVLLGPCPAQAGKRLPAESPAFVCPE